MDADKWPVLEVEPTSMDGELLTQEEDLMDNQMDIHMSEFDDSAEDGSQGWVSPPSKKKTQRVARRKVVMATRASTRIPKDGVPIATKAILRAQGRDNLLAEMGSAA
ncbi:hypothetical protein C2845_PM01G03730 [Panicum miliaceum]|uniref:Uncharacterized protein n=1 Tax=Panicum miliaceum TaxID=4540 RepID=A0A3L6TJ42_PANMI|nr:hypothetical protein C2845_PM01G03730 [Panicum miliaceum]